MSDDVFDRFAKLFYEHNRLLSADTTSAARMLREFTTECPHWWPKACATDEYPGRINPLSPEAVQEPLPADHRVVDLGVSGIGVHPVGGYGVPHRGCQCGTCQDARRRMENGEVPPGEPNRPQWRLLVDRLYERGGGIVHKPELVRAIQQALRDAEAQGSCNSGNASSPPHTDYRGWLAEGGDADT